MKLDVEGAEALVLQGARLTLAHHRPVVFVALHGKQEEETCGLILESLDYELFTLNGTSLTANPRDVDDVYALPGKEPRARKR